MEKKEESRHGSDSCLGGITVTVGAWEMGMPTVVAWFSSCSQTETLREQKGGGTRETVSDEFPGTDGASEATEHLRAGLHSH